MKLTSIRTRLVLSLILIIATAAAIYGVNLWQNSGNQEDLQEISDRSTPILLALQEYRSNWWRLMTRASAFAILATSEDREAVAIEFEAQQTEFFEAFEAMEAASKDYQELANTTETWVIATQLVDLSQEIYLEGLELIGQYRLGIERAATGDLNDIQALEDQMNEQVDKALALETANFNKTEDRLDERGTDAAYLQAGLLIFSIVLLGTVVWGVINGVVRPLSRLEAASDVLRGGKFDHRVAVRRQDELGRLGTAFNDMATSLQRRDNQLRAINKQLEQQLDETQKAREAAERADQVKSAFLASMSHELRTPLNSVINFTKFVARGMMGPVTDEQVQTLNEVIDSAKHLLNLINDVLDMSKIESGSLRLFVEDNVDIRAVLDQVVSTGKSLIVDRPVQITTEIDGRLPSIRGDRQRLLQILLNIMSNACKFTEQGQIVVRAEQHDSAVTISIQDSGPGIAPEDQSLVFEAFKQTHTGLRQGGGTGLGMPISRNLTEAHGGKMWLESAPDQGATFFVELPIQSAMLTPVQVEGKSK